VNSWVHDEFPILATQEVIDVCGTITSITLES
jgi:hypothetical protein